MPKASARCATMAPTRPTPTMPSVLPASSTPWKRSRAHVPPFRDAVAAGMFRTCARSRAIVCSAAETMFDCGAFTTITPLRVAASTSTLSRPIPARAMTFRLSAASMTGPSTRTRTRPPPRSRGLLGPGEDLLGCGHAGAALHGVPHRPEGRLEGGQAPDDVEAIEVTQVADAEDFPLQRPLPRGQDDPMLVPDAADQLVAVDPLRGAHGGDRPGPFEMLAVEVQAEGADAFLGGPGEDPMPFQHRLGTLLLE